MFVALIKKYFDGKIELSDNDTVDEYLDEVKLN